MSMSISNTGATSALSTIASVARTSSSPSNGSVAEAGLTGSDKAAISGPAAMLSKLKSLQASDPTQFKEVMTKISDSLSERAESATDPGEKKMLTDLASKFKTAGETGDLSALDPSKGGGGGPRGPHGPPPAGGGHGPKIEETKEAKATEPADTNEDGTVSQQEKAAYEAKQAASGAQSYAKQAAAAVHEKMDTVMKSIESIVDAAIV